jgi:dihydrodipicolinate synthase/N-acetylneuraminate lyase
MTTMQFTTDHLRSSVIAVPPLARDAALNVCPTENAKIIRFLEAGGIRSLLYGGNAVFYHVRLGEYADLLSMLTDAASDETMVVPSIGSSYGIAVDQVDVLRDYDFPTVMLLPARDVVDQIGIARAIRILADHYGKPIVVYIKYDRWLEPKLIESLENDGAIAWIKYAVVRDDTSDDDYLREVMEVFPAERIVSGIGEQPAIVHLRDFGLAGFTSGCVCVAPERSMQMLRAIQAGDIDGAETTRSWFRPLEDLRNEINPIRVLHHAVELAGVAKTGPLMPMLSELSNDQRARINAAVADVMGTI